MPRTETPISRAWLGCGKIQSEIVPVGFLQEKVLAPKPHHQSPASLALLKKHLLNEENQGKVDWQVKVHNIAMWLKAERSKGGGLLICTYCGLHPLEIGGDDFRTNATRDHIYPQSKGGTDDDSNLTVACHRCNGGKKDMLPEDKRLAGRLKWVGRDLRVDPLAPPRRTTKGEWFLDWPYWRLKKEG